MNNRKITIYLELTYCKKWILNIKFLNKLLNAFILIDAFF